MALVTGNYKLKRNENLVEYLTGTGNIKISIFNRNKIVFI